MSWFEILLNKDQIRAGELKKFQQAFRDASMRLDYQVRWDFLPVYRGATANTLFYLTPVCSKFAENFISHYSGTPL